MEAFDAEPAGGLCQPGQWAMLHPPRSERGHSFPGQVIFCPALWEQGLNLDEKPRDEEFMSIGPYKAMVVGSQVHSPFLHCSALTPCLAVA